MRSDGSSTANANRRFKVYVNPRLASGAPIASDRQLLESMAQGDKSAIRRLFTRHHMRIYRFVIGITGDPSTTEDVVNEVFVDAWRQARSFEARSSVSTWLLATARDKAISRTRRYVRGATRGTIN